MSVIPRVGLQLTIIRRRLVAGDFWAQVGLFPLIIVREFRAHPAAAVASRTAGRMLICRRASSQLGL